MGESKALAFHSYRGGTGKTTLAANLAATFANMGLNVCLLDFDLYAPSLSSYFQKIPELYLNDLLAGRASLSDILVDVSSELDLKGKLLLGFSSPRKGDIHEIEIKHDLKWQRGALERFLTSKNELISDYDIDYIFLDTPKRDAHRGDEKPEPGLHPRHLILHLSGHRDCDADSGRLDN